jgi:class 3 adenylate cyclase/tetratricopeptide (TPR) repeat protein
VRCPGCQEENAAKAAFCRQCGKALGSVCTACGAAGTPGSRFCTRCGTAIEPTPAVVTKTPDAEAERRHLTVLFCDLVDSTRIASQVGDERWLGLLRAYQERAADAIERFDGSVAQYLGDGVLAYFGFPKAHEDDAQRAVHAGLAIAEEMATRRTDFEARYGQGLSVRVGIHTGPAVVGELGSGESHETLAVGETANLTARIQSAAEPDTVLVSDATLRLVRGIFVTTDVGRHELKGVRRPVRLHRVLRPSGARSRLDAASSEGLTPFVGRADEIELLLEQWRRVHEGHGQVVLIGGEPGIGKSRLLQVFRERLIDESHAWIECRASNLDRHTAFHPLSELLDEMLDLRNEAAAEEKLERLAAGLDAAGLAPSETVPLFARLLGLAPSGREEPLPTSADVRRHRTIEALVEWLLALARPQPAVLVFEDLHWTDSSTLEVLGRLIERVARAPMLLLPTFRTPFEPPWSQEPHVQRVALRSLTHHETEAMVEGIMGGRSLPPLVLDRVIQETDGVPLFVEEFTRMVLESGLLVEHEGRYERADPLPEYAVPATLQDSLMARLDHLGPAKGVAQLAAVLGRDFSYELLAAVSSASQPLESDLEELVRSGILERRGGRDGPAYSFRHALIQETAYGSLLGATRRTWHARVVGVMEAQFPKTVTAEPERLAWHCEEARLIEKAARYYGAAGERAAQRSASAEAIRHLTRGIDLLRAQPDAASQSELELMLQIELGTTLVATKGWGSPEAAAAHERARALCEQLGDPPELFRVMRSLITFYTATAELGTAHDLATRLIRLAERSGESSLLLLSHEQLAILEYFLGNPSSALEHFERAIALYDPSKHRDLTHRYGEDLGVFTRIWTAWALWILGRPEQAVERSREALALGAAASHPFSHAYALLWSAILHVMRREPALAAELARQAIAIAEAGGFAFVLAGGRLVAAWAQVEQPPPEVGRETAVEAYRECVTQLGTTGNKANGPLILAYLADAHHRVGRDEEALTYVDAGLALSQTTRQRHWDAELHRMKGTLLLRGDDSKGAEEEFDRAIEIAREQRAKSLELRAAVSLGRLWQARRQPERCRALLARVLAEFNEGFDTPDLVTARTLLESAGGPHA